MIERAVEITQDPSDVTLLECLGGVEVRMDSRGRQRLGPESLRDYVKREVGLANQAAKLILSETQRLRVINGRAVIRNALEFSREEVLAFTAICWTIKDGFGHTQPDPYENSWGQIVDQTRTNLAEDGVLGSIISEPADPDAKFSTKKTTYEDFTKGRLRVTKHGSRDSGNTERDLSAAEVFSETQKWDTNRLETLYGSLEGSVDPVQSYKLPPPFISERIVRISEIAAQRPSSRSIEDVEEFFFKYDVRVCMQLMELLGVNDLIDLEAAVRRMAASGDKASDLRVNTR